MRSAVIIGGCIYGAACQGGQGPGCGGRPAVDHILLSRDSRVAPRALNGAPATTYRTATAGRIAVARVRMGAQDGFHGAGSTRRSPSPAAWRGFSPAARFQKAGLEGTCHATGERGRPRQLALEACRSSCHRALGQGAAQRCTGAHASPQRCWFRPPGCRSWGSFHQRTRLTPNHATHSTVFAQTGPGPANDYLTCEEDSAFELSPHAYEMLLGAAAAAPLSAAAPAWRGGAKQPRWRQGRDSPKSAAAAVKAQTAGVCASTSCLLNATWPLALPALSAAGLDLPYPGPPTCMP